MKSMIRRHAAFSILLGQTVVYALAYLVFGAAGAYGLAIAFLIAWVIGLAIVTEKSAASRRRERSAEDG